MNQIISNFIHKKAPCEFRIGLFYWKSGEMLDGEVFANDHVGELGHSTRY
jgi:hypothetical protein